VGCKERGREGEERWISRVDARREIIGREVRQKEREKKGHEKGRRRKRDK